MTNPNDLGADAQILKVTPGLQTSSGQLTAILTVAALILSAFGYHYSPAQIDTWVQMVQTLITTLGPILALIPVAITYINSRGKIISNTTAANAAIISPTAPSIVGDSTVVNPPATLLGGGTVMDKVVTALPTVAAATSGDLNFKDPNTYGQLLHVASELGVPGANTADVINQQIHPVELITGILSLFHKKQKAIAAQVIATNPVTATQPQ